MLRTRTARWSMGTMALCVLLLVAAWMLLISPRRGEASDLAAQNTTQQQQNATLQVKIDQLKAQAAQLPTYRTQLQAVLQQLPPTAQMPQLVRDLNSMAAASGVSLDTLTPGAATLLTVKPAAGATAGKPTGVAQIPVALVVHGDYFQAVAFLQKVQTQLTRAFLITGVQVAQSSSAATTGQIQLSITGTVFSWPTGAAVTGATTTGGTP